MNIDTRKHPWRISNGIRYAHFSIDAYALAVKTALDRGWDILESRDMRENVWTVVEWR